MLKPTASYKMSKQTKTGLALHKFRDQNARNAWKRTMIEAEISASIQPRITKTKDKE